MGVRNFGVQPDFEMMLPDLAASVDDVLVTGQFSKSAWPASVKLVCADTNFGPQPVFAAIVEPGTCVNVNRRLIDGCREPGRRRDVSRHNRVGVVRAVLVDVSNRLLDVVHDFDRHDQVKKLGVKVFVCGGD